MKMGRARHIHQGINLIDQSSRAINIRRTGEQKVRIEVVPSKKDVRKTLMVTNRVLTYFYCITFSSSDRFLSLSPVSLETEQVDELFAPYLYIYHFNGSFKRSTE